MISVQAYEQYFWSRVWRCGHTHPCKQCCWPWAPTGEQWYASAHNCLWGRMSHASCSSLLGVGTMPVHRVAYILGKSGYMLPFPGRQFPVCHICSYGLCCNPVHLSIGSISDNWQDRKQRFAAPSGTLLIALPDGRRLCFLSMRQGYVDASGVSR
jgi:hypothetical protein